MITNLNVLIAEEDLQELFGRFGEMKSVVVRALVGVGAVGCVLTGTRRRRSTATTRGAARVSLR